ncbi:AAA family ATPase [Chitinophaga sancti]|uniref:AAA family ATPase n=1 Tax=Chitinophaga sancti TaxID=1004 RepID=UPI002A74834D|nr:AAA family ATPase [Chitinophaga sancti]WPQ66085.1 AAA family ATPase [Chitinophaga sancti]
MKIDKIKISNFKIFREFEIDFSSSDTIVFDGPNGFGKTTIYDAIELVFTGRIRRYSALKKDLIDGRQTFSENPFYNENAIGENITITVQLTKNDQTYILERSAESNDIDGSLDFSIYKLHTKNSFESQDRLLIEDEVTYLTNLFGKNYDSNFQFLNYIEQEECLFLLKHSDKTRKNYIGHLFDLKEFEAKIKRIEDLKKRIDAICHQTKKAEIDELQLEVGKITENLTLGNSTSQYIKLFINRDIDWDRDNLDITKINYQSIAETDGILERLKVFISRKEIFRRYQINNGVNYLLEHEEQVKSLFRFKKFLDRKDEFRALKTKNISLQTLIEQLNKLSNTNLEGTIDINIHSFISQEIRERFVKSKDELRESINELSGLDKIYSDISASRNQLKDKLDALKNIGNSNGECMLCGYDWGSIENLLNQIELKSIQIKEINSEKSNRFNESFLSFKSGIVQELVEIIEQELSTNTYDIPFVEELLNTENNSLNNILKTFDFLQFDYSKYLSENQNSNAVLLIDEFKRELLSLKTDIEELLIEPYFKDYFAQYFDNKIESIDFISVENIEMKKNHLHYLWLLSQNELLNTKNKELADKSLKYKDAKIASDQLNTLKGIYQKSLKEFQKKIIKDIEIVFHIYSGRIMQSFQGGLGLFIFSEKEGIRFQSNPYKTYDAVFSMSSGQLSALIISFTLALHKKYSQNRIILIDDPVQTMDELNLYGFVDLLRNEFGNNQIIMSTHEDMMSAFMRYKFKNYNLSEKRINLKEMLQGEY